MSDPDVAAAKRARVEPAEPVEPIVLAEPVEPILVVEPAEPAEPVEPVEPVLVEPAKPAEPAEPAKPAEPIVTVQSTKMYGNLLLTEQQAKLSPVLARLDHQAGDTISLPQKVEQAETLQLWFDQVSVQDICAMYGLVSLGRLLAAADYLALDECVASIVAHSTQQAKQVPRQVDQRSRQVYTQLASQSRFPPVSIDWPGVAELCWLCIIMPSILDCKLDHLFVDKLIDVSELRVLNQRLFCPGKTSLTMDESVVQAGKDFFACVKADGAGRLLRLMPGSPVAKLDLDLNHTVLAESSCCSKQRLTASPDGKHLLWHTWTDSLGKVFVLNAETRTKLDMLPALESSRICWWLSSTELAFEPPGDCLTFVAVKLDDLNVCPPMWSTWTGTKAVKSQSMICRTVQSVCRGHDILLFGDDDYKHHAWMRSFDCFDDFEIVCPDNRDPTGSTFVCKDARGHFTVVAQRSGATVLTDEQVDQLVSRLVWKL